MGEEAVLAKNKPKLNESAKKKESRLVPVRKPSVTCEDISAMKEVSYVYGKKGKHPEIIIIAQFHPVFTREMNITLGEKQIQQSIESIEKMSLNLYDRFSVRSIMIEGLPPESEKVYGGGYPIQVRTYPGMSPLMLQYASFVEKTVNGRKWTLRSGELAGMAGKEVEEKDVGQICAEFSKTVDRIIEKSLMATGKVRGKEFSYDKEKCTALIQKLYNEELVKAKAKMNSMLTPNRMAQLFKIQVLDREEKFFAKAEKLIKEGNGPVIIIIGASHLKTFSDRIRNRFNYIAVCPLDPNKVNANTEINPEELKKSLFQKLEGSANFNVNINITKEGTVKVTH